MNLLNRKDAAEVLGIKPRTLWHWQHKGWLKPFMYVGNKPRYNVEDVAAAALRNNSINQNLN